MNHRPLIFAAESMWGAIEADRRELDPEPLQQCLE